MSFIFLTCADLLLETSNNYKMYIFESMWSYHINNHVVYWAPRLSVLLFAFELPYLLDNVLQHAVEVVIFHHSLFHSHHDDMFIRCESVLQYK